MFDTRMFGPDISLACAFPHCSLPAAPRLYSPYLFPGWLANLRIFVFVDKA
jgi:hypothetical protein